MSVKEIIKPEHKTNHSVKIHCNIFKAMTRRDNDNKDLEMGIKLTLNKYSSQGQ